MDRGAWWATKQGVSKELDMTERLNNSNNLELEESQVRWFSMLAEYQNHLRERTFNKCSGWNFSDGQVAKTLLLLQGAQVQPLVRELSSHMPLGVAKM